ncbi:PIN domain-containing protein [Methylobacterium indicum]|uniref:PIN domain-containing protein n=1 Tax=Methylobacterium indicum TaxID=1775910 RepID=A0A8H8WQU5_9HYPH|nr:PIN domain-containing protein [Methylobacterium indicum]BCM82675.1 hypothetical protein mvi_11360 [Methylobacterium indicum]
MLTYLLDTDVISKRGGPNGKAIRRWLASIDDNALAISAITVFEIARGVQKKRDAGDAAVAATLQAALDALKEGFAGRILPVDGDVAEAWGRPPAWIARNGWIGARSPPRCGTVSFS